MRSTTAFVDASEAARLLLRGAPPAVIRDVVPERLILDVMRYRIAVHTGWTLEYIDGLPVEDAWGVLGYLKGEIAARGKPPPRDDE